MTDVTVVRKDDVVRALQELGVKPTDTIIVHSSLKSFGYVEGGAAAVIDGLKTAVCDGTLVFPTLRLTNIPSAYTDWNVDTTPSDTGFLSEYFRKCEGVTRSNQATHSVCAIGKDAQYLTENHGLGTPRIGVFGDTPFCTLSPWQKMYDTRAKVVMIGVTMVYNTFKHFLEYKIVSDILDGISDDAKKQTAISAVSRFSDTAKYYLDGEVAEGPDGVWLWNDGLQSQRYMEALGFLTKTTCGQSTIICFDAKTYVDWHYKEMLAHPEDWFSPKAADWIKTYYKK